jgi:hypothetical protein
LAEVLQAVLSHADVQVREPPCHHGYSSPYFCWL